MPTEPGAVFELNNASKHTVYNGWDQPRIHLIFDYVDEDEPVPAATALQQGAVLLQTRRTIDIAGAPMKHSIPQFCIIGAQKAGTTSVYDYLCEHPLVVPAYRKEPHFLDWRWNPDGLRAGALGGDGGGAECDVAGLREQWAEYFEEEGLAAHVSLMTGEATPSYLLGGELVARRLRALAPAARLVVIMRDPARRALSHHGMCADGSGSAAQVRPAAPSALWSAAHGRDPPGGDPASAAGS